MNIDGLMARFNARSRRWYVSNGFRRLTAWGTFDNEGDALGAIAIYRGLPPQTEPPVNLGAAMRARRVNVFPDGSDKPFLLGADLREVFGDQDEQYREALYALIEKGEHVIGGGGAPMFRLVVAAS